MEKFSAETHTQSESISDEALDRLRGKFDAAISLETASERASALEALIASCAGPLEVLESGTTLSPEYSGFLESLTKMHMLESAHAKVEQLFSSVT